MLKRSVPDGGCDPFLQWALPRIELHWQGFRRVRRQVCRRVGRRLLELGLGGFAAYQRHLEQHPEEWSVLRELCLVHISRFWRDRAVFEGLRQSVLPALAEAARRRDDRTVRVWSAGCAAGEEPYTVAMLWKDAVQPRFAEVTLFLLATDTNEGALTRARAACYKPSSLKEVPPELRRMAFATEGGLCCLREEIRSLVQLRRQDITTELPEGPFDLILCRNSAFTYFAPPLRERIARQLLERLRSGGVLVLGRHERPDGTALGLRAHPQCPSAYLKEATPRAADGP
jgi:chemotaxis protein methyltransferase CheR